MPLTDSPFALETALPNFSTERYTEHESKQSAAFYASLDQALGRHLAEIESQRKQQMQEIDSIIQKFSLKFEEFQTVFEWRQNLGKGSEQSR